MREISRTKNDVVFVGSWVARVHNKLRRRPHDIDIVVTSIDGLETFGETIFKESSSPMSVGCKRSVIERKDGKIDIWLCDELPEYEIINGMKFITIEKQKEYYKNVIDSTDDKFLINILTRKLEILN